MPDAPTADWSRPIRSGLRIRSSAWSTSFHGAPGKEGLQLELRAVHALGEVRTASNLGEARQVLVDRKVELEVILTDVVLSGESGTELIAVARALRPSK